jgi:hypothetical protein
MTEKSKVVACPNPLGYITSLMRISLHITIVLCLAGFVAAGQDKPTNPTDLRGLEFLPGSPILPPLIANHQEPRVGVRKEIGTSRLKLDIGSSLDLLGYSLDAAQAKQLRFGVEFFTYALTSTFRDYRLQVDAVDGFFGGHIMYRADDGQQAFALRLRVLHLSAHLVDGHTDPETHMWRDGRLPIAFTRDFGELLAFAPFSLGRLAVSPYAGFSYATLVRPTALKRWGGMGGVEIHSGELLGPVFGRPLEIYAADNLTVAGVPEWVGTNVAELGVKFGGWNSSGFRIYINYASGLEMFSQYYDVRSSRGGVGFAFDVR